jgi:hypothetical protein
MVDCMRLEGGVGVGVGVGVNFQKVRARKGEYRTVDNDVDVFVPLGEMCARVCDSSRASQ